MSTIDYTDLGLKIRMVRQRAQLSQEQLAEKCNISTSFLGHIERGTRIMSLETFVSLCSVLNISADYLLSDELPTSNPVLLNIIESAKANGTVQYEKFVFLVKSLSLVVDKL